MGWSWFGLNGKGNADSQILKNIAQDIKQGEKPLIAMNRGFKDLTDNGKRLAIQARETGKQTGNMSGAFLDASTALNKTALASKAAAAGMKVLSIAGNMLLVLAISTAINAVIKFTQHTEELRKKALDSAQAFNETTTSLESYKNKVIELQTALHSGNLSQGEAYDARAQLLQIQDEVIEKYGKEAEGINLVSGSLHDQIKALDEVAIRQAKKNLLLNDSSNKKAVSEIEATKTHLLGYYIKTDTTDFAELDKLIKQFNNRGIALTPDGNASVSIKLNANVNDAENTLMEFYDKLERLNIDNELKQNIGFGVKNSLEQVQKTVNAYAQIYDAYNFERIITNKDYSEIYKEAEDALESYTKAFKSGNQEQLDSSIKAMAAIKEKALSSTDDVGYQDFFENFFYGVQFELDKHQFKIDIEANKDGLSDVINQLNGLDKTEVQALEFDGTGTEEQKQAYESLAEAANAYGIELNTLLDYLVEFGIIQGRISDEPIAPEFSANDAISSLSTLQEKFSSISAAAKDFADVGTVSMASLAGMSKEFGNLKGYEDLVRVLSDVSPAAEDVERALSALIGEYITSNEAVKNVDSSTRALIQRTLEEMGVLNAEEVATSALAQAQNNLAAQKFLAATPDFLNACYSEAVAVAMLTGQADETKQAIFNLTMQKALLADSSLSGMAAEGVQSLLNLATAAGITGVAIDQLKEKIAAKNAIASGNMSPSGLDGQIEIVEKEIDVSGFSMPKITIPKMDWGNFSSGADKSSKSQKDVNEALTEFLALLEHRKNMDEFVNNENEYVKALIYAYQNLTKTEEERRDLVEKIYAARKQQLEVEKSALEAAAQAVIRKYDDEIDCVNDAIDVIDIKIKRHEKEKSNLEAAHNAVIRLLDKEIEKLRTKYDEEIKQIEDKKSKYEQAHSAVMDAIDAEIKKYEDQKTAIDDLYQPQIDAIQEQIDLLQKKNEETKKEIELEKAKATLASANSQKVNQIYKEGVGFVYEADGDAILEAQQKLDELAREKEVSDLEDKKTGLETERDDKKSGIDEQIEALQKYKEKWDEILSAFEKQQNIDIANSILGPNWSSDVLSENLDIMNQFKDGYLGIQQQLTDITAEQDAANARADILEQYKQQWEDELDAYKNAEEERLGNRLFYAGWEQDILNGRQDAFNIFKDSYLDIQQKITDDTKKRESLEKDVKRLEEYKEMWQNELDSYQRFEDEKRLIALYGKDWEKEIFDNREDALAKFKVAYGNIQNQIAEIGRDAIGENYDLEKSIKALAEANDEYVDSIDRRIAAKERERDARENDYSGEGYASGTSHGKQGWHRVDEFGTEAKMTKMNGNYAFIKDGDVVFNRSQTEFLYSFSRMHQPAMLSSMAEDYMKMAEPLSNVVNVPAAPSVTQVTQHFDNITLPNVKDFQDFLSEIGRIGLDARQVNFKQ